MKYLLVFFYLSISLTAHAGNVFTSYEDYYQKQHGVLFVKALEESDGGYSIKGEHGLCGEEDACQDINGNIGQKKIKITVSLTQGAFQINGRRFNYADSRMLSGVRNTSERIPLYGASAYIAKKVKNSPDMVCIEGYYAGSGRFRNTEVFLVINPLGVMNKIQFLHLPGLHSSCVAVRQEPDGFISYPINSYIPDGDSKHSTGLLIKYFVLKNGAPQSLNREIRLRFIKAGDPFKFINDGNN